MNKKVFLTAIIAVIAMALGFTSCSDDDEVKIPNEAVTGTYTGGIYGSFFYMPKYMAEAGQTITVVANKGSETATVTFSHETWGEFRYDEVSVTKNADGSYSLAGEGYCVVVPRYGGGSASNAEAKEYVTDFTGTIANGKLVAVLDIPSMMQGGTKIYFNPDDFDEVFENENKPKE